MSYSWKCPFCGQVFEKESKQKLAVAVFDHNRKKYHRAPPSRLPSGASNPAYFRFWYELNKSRKKEYERRDYIAKADAWKARSAKYYSSHREKMAATNKAYHNTPEGRAVFRKSMVKTQARRRGLPILFVLNEPFTGAHLHHVEENIGVYVPKQLHDSIRHNLKTGKRMVEINEAISDWLSTVTDRLSE